MRAYAPLSVYNSIRLYTRPCGLGFWVGLPWGRLAHGAHEVRKGVVALSGGGIFQDIDQGAGADHALGHLRYRGDVLGAGHAEANRQRQVGVFPDAAQEVRQRRRKLVARPGDAGE